MFNQSVSRRSFLTISAMTAAALALDWSRVAADAAKMGPKSDYPTVIIGAGLGGLVCGAYLAKQGVPVTVVEQHSIAGGYATAFERAYFNAFSKILKQIARDDAFLSHAHARLSERAWAREARLP